MKSKSVRVWLSIVFMGLAVVGYAQTETLTLTTYYPAPFGIYNEVRSRRLAVGPNYYDPTQYPSFVDDAIDTANEIERYAYFITEGWVGIGTEDPDGELHIVEKPRPNAPYSVSHRPMFIMEDLDTIPTTTDPYRFQITLKSPRTDGDYGLNLYFPLHSSEPSDGMFMSVTEEQKVRFLGNVNITKSTDVTSTGLGIGIPHDTVAARPLHVRGGVRFEPTNLPTDPADGDMVFESGAGKRLKWYANGAWVPASVVKVDRAGLVTDNNNFNLGNTFKMCTLQGSEAGTQLTGTIWKDGTNFKALLQRGNENTGVLTLVAGSWQGHGVSGPRFRAMLDVTGVRVKIDVNKNWVQYFCLDW